LRQPPREARAAGHGRATPPQAAPGRRRSARSRQHLRNGPPTTHNPEAPGACLGHGPGDIRGQQRCLAGSRDSALTSGECSEQQRSRGHVVYGMQGVRGSNPLSSTPGQRPTPALTVPGSPVSGSRSAASCCCRVDPVVQRGGDAGGPRLRRLPVAPVHNADHRELGKRCQAGRHAALAQVRARRLTAVDRWEPLLGGMYRARPARTTWFGAGVATSTGTG
jgi:hypothetical protein